MGTVSAIAADILADELRHARAARGLSQDDFGRLINYSGTHVSAVETGTRPPTREYLTAVDRNLDTAGLFVRLYGRLAEMDSTPGWLQDWIGVEQHATALRWYEYAWVPGLLQTDAYARAVFDSDDSTPRVEDIDARVAARLARQAVLANPSPPRLTAILDESLLHRPVGGPTVMRDQLLHLAKLNTDNRRVRIHVVPSIVGAYAGLAGPFIVATTPQDEEIVYLDNRLQGQIVDRPADLALVRRQWEATLAEALTLQQSTELMTGVAQTWT